MKNQLSFLSNETPLPQISYSKIVTFFQCPLKYRNKYINGQKQYSAPSLEMNFGNSIHNILKIFLTIKNKAERTLPKLLSILENNWINNNPRGANKANTQYDYAQQLLINFFHNQDPCASPFLLEHSFKLKLEKAIIIGRIDRVDKLLSGKFEIIDYKTLEPLISQEEANQNIQLTIYYVGLHDFLLKLGGPIDKLTFYFLDKNIRLTTTRSSEKLKEYKHMLEKIINQIMLEEIFPPTPNHYCSICNFVKSCPKMLPKYHP